MILILSEKPCPKSLSIFRDYAARSTFRSTESKDALDSLFGAYSYRRIGAHPGSSPGRLSSEYALALPQSEHALEGRRASLGAAVTAAMATISRMATTMYGAPDVA